MAKQTRCYVLMVCERIGEGQQIIAVYTSAKAADKNKIIYQRSQEQYLESRNMFLTVIEARLNTEFE